MTRYAITLSAATALLLGACEITVPLPEPPPYASGRPKAELVATSHAVLFSPGAEQPSLAERARLEAFLRGMVLGPRDHIYLVTGTDARSLRRAAAVAADLEALGHPAETPRQAPSVAVPEDAVAVVVERAVVEVPDCGLFPGPDPWERAANLPSPNFGCATARNLAVHVHDPRDLVAGRPLGPASGEREARAVEAYRQGRTKPLADPNEMQYRAGSSK